MKDITKTQIAAVHVLLDKHGLTDDKANIIKQISNGRTSSTRELKFEEAMRWINAMNNKQPNDSDKKQRMFKHIIAMAHEMGWIKKEKRVMREGDIKVVNIYDDLHAWVEKYGYLHKPMHKYTYEELPKLVTQFKAVYADKMKLKPKT